jgi:predicted AlkP superfamily pyrophosphatase or phosphodiesterase
MKTKRPSGAFVAILFVAAVLVPAVVAQNAGKGNQISHVLLVSIDGMHAVDYLNCSQGVKGVNGGQPYCSNLAKLGATGVNYLDTSTSRPSDSFPGLMAIMTGGTRVPWASFTMWPTTGSTLLH